jgi:SAM-dependent methyltransferase
MPDMNKEFHNFFDQYSDNYHQSLNETLSISGENTTFFAFERVKWMKYKIDKLLPDFAINSLIDFGCGTGDTLPILDHVFHPDKLLGIDISEECITVARNNNQTSKISFYCSSMVPEDIKYELVYCNGVFHHIPIEERDKAANTIYNSLSSNGILAFWENNLWNPGARYIMHKCPFDENAIVISTFKAKQMLKQNGFKIIDISFCFIFPKSLNFLRFSEKALSSFPFGAQYLILAQKN